MRARFTVAHSFNGGQNIVLRPIQGTPAYIVHDGNTRKDVIVTPYKDPPEDNVEFFDHPTAEPGGEIRLLMVDPETAKEFPLGREFVVEFTPST